MSKNISLTILALFTLTFFLIPYFFPRTPIKKASLQAGYWPLSPSKHLLLAHTYFQNSYLENTKKEYYLAKSLYNKIKIMDITNKTKQHFNKIEYLLSKHQRLTKQQEYLQKQNSQYQNSPTLLTNLALLQFQLLEDQKSHLLWQKAFYLNPNNKQISEVKKIIFP